MITQHNHPFLIFNLNDFKAPGNQHVYWKEIYDGDTIRAGYYHLKAGSKDDQKPHEFDEIYWVENGVGNIRIGEKSFNVKAGDIIYVQAHQTHCFHNISRDLDLLVLFSKGAYDPTESISQIDQINQLMLQRDSAKNVRIDFLKKKSMTLGLCMLPKLTNDKSQSHRFDAIIFVLHGTGMFTIGFQKIKVKPGSLIFVSTGMPHQFEAMEGIDLLLLSEMKSTKHLSK